VSRAYAVVWDSSVMLIVTINIMFFSRVVFLTIVFVLVSFFVGGYVMVFFFAVYV